MFIVMILGANVCAQTGTGDTALTYACENGHTDVAEVLLEAGAELVRNVFNNFVEMHHALQIVKHFTKYWCTFHKLLVVN